MQLSQAPDALIGREAELQVLERFLDPAATTRCLVLAGESGIGKTVLWEAAVERARERGIRVLGARSGEAEARLAFACLADLLDGVDLGGLAGLPAPQRSALEVALRRAPPSGLPPETLAIASGLLNALRSLAGEGPILVAIDEVAHVDPASGEALAYAAGRLAGRDLRYLFARRRTGPSELERTIEGAAVVNLEVGPLSFGAINHLLAGRLGRSFPRWALRRLYQTAQGNPLFALELGRSLIERGVPEMGSALPLPDLLDDLFRDRVGRLSPAVRSALIAAALCGDLTPGEFAEVLDPLVVEDAIAGGVLTHERSRLRPSHPLLAAVAVRQSTAAERRDIHRRLGLVVLDPCLRARHLALAEANPDAELAVTAAGAAVIAADRGAVQDAVELAAHALRLTPPGAAERSQRVLTLAHRLLVAGEHARLEELLNAQFATLAPGRERAEGQLLLGEVADFALEVEHLDLAIAESAGDQGVLARALARKVLLLALHRVERLAEAEELANQALAAGRQVGGEVELRTLVTLVWARVLRGRPIEDLVAGWPSSPPASSLYETALDRPAGVRLAFRGDLAAARVSLAGLLALADERGEVRSGIVLHLQMCELALREGDVREAARLLAEWGSWTAHHGEMAISQTRAAALLAALRGEPEAARASASSLIAQTDHAEVPTWDRLEALRASGIAAIFDRDAEGAAGLLNVVWEHTVREGVDDPGAFPVAGDLVEVLVESGALEAARDVTGRLRRLAREQRHPWGLVTTLRSEAVIELATHYTDAAAVALGEAAAEYGRLGFKFERARTLLYLGRVQRRANKRAGARRALEAAMAAFEAAGGKGWAGQTRAELARLSGRRSEAGGLTASERRVAELAAGGLSNKEIAKQLFVTVYTVEAHLSHTYAKLGVRSRAQLALRLASATG